MSESIRRRDADQPIVAPQFLLMLGTSPATKGGIAAVVDTLREGGLFDRAHVRYVVTHIEAQGIAKALQFVRAVIATISALSSGRVALVHAHVSSGASFWRKAVLLALCRACRVPTIFHLHSGAFDQFAAHGSSLKSAFVRRTLQRSSIVIVLSERWQTWVRAFAPGSDVRVVPNPVHVPDVLPRRDGRDKNGQGRVLYLGLISEAKGTFDLLLAWAGFRRVAPGWRLAIGGNGEVEKMLSEAQRLGIAGDVDYLGWITGAAKAQELARADLFALPSYREGMPVSILEAMAYGAVVVATPVGGVPDMLRTEENGLLVPAGDVPSLTHALVRLAESYELRRRLALAARVRVIERYSTEIVVKQWLRMYGDVLRRPNK